MTLPSPGLDPRLDEVRDTGEHRFFQDPALDTLAGIVLELAAEVYVERDRARALEDVLTQAGVIRPGSIDGYQPSTERYAELMQERDALVQRLLGPILAGGHSPG